VLVQKTQNVIDPGPQSDAALSHCFTQRLDKFRQADDSALDQARYHPHISQHR
jgi:hypothetical protein